MQFSLHDSWKSILDNETNERYFQNLIRDVDKEYQDYVCYPPQSLLFSAFNHCTFDDLKVVIIGQDPYHGDGEANGLSFSVNDGVKIPPSLRNIYRELTDDLNEIFVPTSGNLVSWAQQGVLLLNATLSVRKNRPNSHKHLDWNRFTDAVIEKIATEKQHLVFLLWGAFAQKKGAKIDSNKHLILQSGHPSPMSANQGKWFGNKHFSQTNAYLVENGLDPIRWIQ